MAAMEILDITPDNGYKVYTISLDFASNIKSFYKSDKINAEFIISASTEYRNLSVNEMIKQFIAVYEDNADEIKLLNSIVIRCYGNRINLNINIFSSSIKAIFDGIKNVDFLM